MNRLVCKSFALRYNFLIVLFVKLSIIPQILAQSITDFALIPPNVLMMKTSHYNVNETEKIQLFKVEKYNRKTDRLIIYRNNKITKTINRNIQDSIILFTEHDASSNHLRQTKIINNNRYETQAVPLNHDAPSYTLYHEVPEDYTPSSKERRLLPMTDVSRLFDYYITADTGLIYLRIDTIDTAYIPLRKLTANYTKMKPDEKDETRSIYGISGVTLTIPDIDGGRIVYKYHINLDDSIFQLESKVKYDYHDSLLIRYYDMINTNSFKHIYKFDEYGNWKERITIQYGEVVRKTVRSIKYIK